MQLDGRVGEGVGARACIVMPRAHMRMMSSAERPGGVDWRARHRHVQGAQPQAGARCVKQRDIDMDIHVPTLQNGTARHHNPTHNALFLPP